MHEPSNCRVNRRCAAKIIFIALGIGIVVVGLLSAKSSRKSDETYKESHSTLNYCTTFQCLKQAFRIRKNMDKSVDPCTDFYNFTCGNFVKYKRIPRDQTRSIIILDNAKIIETELISAYNSNFSTFIKPLRNIHRFFHQCINSINFENSSIESLKELLFTLKWPLLYNDWNEPYQKIFYWLDWEIQIARMGLSPVFLITELTLDMRNFSSAYISLDCTQPILRKEMLLNKTVLNEYQKVIQSFFELLGKNDHKLYASEILNFFLAIEKIKPTKFELSDSNFFHSFRTMQISQLAKELNIDIVYFLNEILPVNIKVDNSTILGTNTYKCLGNIMKILENANKRILANYMMWIAVQNLMWILSKETRKLDFRLNQIFTGVEATLSLNRMCLNFIDNQLPEIATAVYIKTYNLEEKKKQLSTMTELIITELMKEVNSTDWMDTTTKLMGKEKIKKLTYEIINVDLFAKDDYLTSTYKNLNITTNLVENIRHIRRISYLHMMDMVHWSSNQRKKAALLPLSHIINAFYHPGLNAIALPAGIAHGYIYSDDQEAYLNFGAIGAIIGHELSHIFDNIGRLYDADGNFVNWWTSAANLKFLNQSKCFIKQYNKFRIDDNLKVNGTLTLGENMADVGGTLLSYKAYLNWLKKHKVKKLPGLERFTEKQMYWITLGNTWCDKIRLELLEEFLKVDVHSPGKFRVLGPLMNYIEFSEDFNCSTNAPMNKKDKCSLW